MRLAFCLFLTLLPSLRAQSAGGQIDVQVNDPTGAAVPDANVSITGTQTGSLVRTVRTTGTGLAAVPLLNPGTYDIKIEKEGFKSHLQKGVVLRVTETVSLRITLELGATSQSVNIEGDTPLVNTASNALGQVIDDHTIQQLPLNGRNYMQLSLLTPGVVPSANKDQSFSAYGNRGMQNQYLLDGGTNQSYIRGIDNHQRDALRPSLEAILEFKVQTGNFSAEYGSSAGGVVSVVTRSGTNEIHGSVFNFLRNAAINARDFFAPGGNKPPLVYNQFGGSLGGPLRKNKAFLFGAYQGTEIRQSQVNISTVPSAAMKGGAFPNVIFDPFTTSGTGAAATRTPYANNTVPSSAFNSIGRTLAATYPDPNRAGAASNFIRTSRYTTSLQNLTIRHDYTFSDKDNLFARFSMNRGTLSGEAALPEPAGTGVNQNMPAWNAGLGYTHVFSPTLVNEFRFAWTRPGIDKDATLAKNEIIPGALAPGVNSSTPTFGVNGFAGLGAQPVGLTNVPLAKTSAAWEFSDNATKMHGNHIFKMGFTYQFLKFYTFTTLNGRGNIGFDGSYTQNPQARPNTGAGLADMLLGLAQSVATSSTGVSDLRAQNGLWYFQDDWKVTPRLTLNLGVRYELYWTIYDTQNKYANFVTAPGSPDFGKMIFAGLDGRSRSLMNADKNNFAPRVGFAYRIPNTGDLTVRGGYGMFYGNPDEQTGVGAMMTNNPPFVGYGSVNLAGDRVLPSTAFNLSGRLPTPIVLTNPKDFVLLPTATTTLFSWPSYYLAPVVHQWNLSLQKQLPGKMVLEATYVGNSSYGLWNSVPSNQPLTPGPGGIPARRRYASITQAPITGYTPWGRSYYEGLSTRLEKRMSSGLAFLHSFTWGRGIDLSSGAALDGCAYCGVAENIQNPYDLRAQRGPMTSNAPLRSVLSINYDVPFGKGRKYLQSGPGAAILGDWQFSGIWVAQDGTPFTLNLALDNANMGTTNWPNRSCSGRLDSPTPQRYYDATCFSVPAPFTFGNTGRNPLYGPGQNNVDFSVHRFIPIPLKENMKLEFRGEFFNVFNRTQFAMPNVTIGQPQTAQITATSNPNRQLQFALKLAW
ncbi:MAG: TonB-dependent receptor [Acidobacteria bacterium]|nr:TonB-dependent receptor [Acidobacteriota bacterium]